LKIGVYSEWIFISFYSILLGLAFYKLIKKQFTQKKEKTKEKRWLFEEIIHQYGGFAGIIIFRFIYSFKSLITQMIF
jgi:membrane protein DedA with SNARE-associated domain